MGYYRAGFIEIVGVDIKPQPAYPFTFVQADASCPTDAIDYHAFDVIHASPPCQHYTQMLNHGLTPRTNHSDLVDPVRRLLRRIGLPYVIENVPGAPLLNPVTLCGEMFGLRVIRHRLFESSFILQQPAHPPHDTRGAIRKQGDGGHYYRVYGHETGKASWGAAMGIDWMRSPELAQAVPPTYTEWIGKRLLKAMKGVTT
jgi:DNA (cytosine-5)-methyltransferase 1